MTFSEGDTSLLSANNAVSTLDGVLSQGNFYLADASALTVAGNDVAFGSFNLPITNIAAGNSGPGNVYLESTNAAGISFGQNNTVTISSSANGLISVQADTVNFGSHGTGFTGGTLEYAPATQGATATLGASGGLVDNVVGFGVNLIRVGAVTVPGTGETTTAGAISVDGAFNANGLRVNSTPRAPSPKRQAACCTVCRRFQAPPHRSTSPPIPTASAISARSRRRAPSR